MDIKNCAAIVSGGASGMGAATAKALIKAGAKVTILDINATAVEKTAKEIGAYAAVCDITNEEQTKAAIDKAAQQHGAARICINCAGVVYGHRVVGKEGPMPLADFKRIIDINLVGTFNLMRLAAASMIPQEPIGESAERGVIINTASIAAYEGQIGQTAYSASKGGIVGMTLPAARDLSNFGIRVMTIAPGLVATPMFASFTPEAQAALGNSVPFPKRLAQPEEYARLALHIIENAMLNGSVIRLDGALRLPPK